MNRGLRSRESKVNAWQVTESTPCVMIPSMGRWLILSMVVMLSGCAQAPLPSPYGPAPGAPRADKILIEKSERRMTLYRYGKPWKTYRVALGRGGLAPKMQEGDQRTPEGLYYIEARNPQSIYHLSLRLNYPGPEDKMRALKMGVRPGSDIMIHGLPNGKGYVGRRHLKKDWTEGCIAVTNQEIEELWTIVADGTPVEIRP